MAFAQRLRELRKKSGLTQRELEVKLMIRKGGINDFELENRLPNIRQIKDLAKLFKVHECWLAFGHECANDN